MSAPRPPEKKQKQEKTEGRLASCFPSAGGQPSLMGLNSPIRTDFRPKSHQMACTETDSNGFSQRRPLPQEHMPLALALSPGQAGRAVYAQRAPPSDIKNRIRSPAIAPPAPQPPSLQGSVPRGASAGIARRNKCFQTAWPPRALPGVLGHLSTGICLELNPGVSVLPTFGLNSAYPALSSTTYIIIRRRLHRPWIN